MAEFQIDGLFTVDHFLNHTGGIGSENLTSFTLCMRLNINFLRGRMSHPLSYTSDFSDNTLLVYYVIEEGDYLDPIG